MELSELYDLIRNEPVCLFIGSGFSLYTGMPSAYKLIDLLHDSLSPTQQKKIVKRYDLRKYTEDFQVTFGRPKLIDALQQYFDVEPADTHIHELLGKISYFRSILTTNYDRLIENGFGARATVICNDQQVFGSRKARTRVMKIHGDIRDGKNIVITNSDYSKQYNRIFKDPFWATVIAEISAHHIVFLGFGYEDENIQSDFEHIEKKLKNKYKKRILVSPGTDPLKLKRYRQLGLTHIPATGETFVNGLVDVLKRYVKRDMEDGVVDQQTAMDFITAFDMEVNIRSDQRSAQLLDIKKSNGPTRHDVTITTSDEELKAALHQFTTGYTLRELRILPEQLDSFTHLIEGFSMVEKDTLALLNFSITPKYDGMIRVRFTKKLFNLHKVHCRLFNSIPGKVRIELEVAGFEAEFDIELKDGRLELNFAAREPEFPMAVNKSYDVFRAFYLLFSGEEFELVHKDGVVQKLRLNAPGKIAEFKKQMEFFYILKKAEKLFSVKFDPIRVGDVSDGDRQKVEKLAALFHHGYYAIKQADGVIIERMPDSQELFDQFCDLEPGTFVSLITKNYTDMELFGRTLIMGNEQITVKGPSVPLLDREALRMQLVPDDDILVYHYEKFGLTEIIGARSIWPLPGSTEAE